MCPFDLLKNPQHPFSFPPEPSRLTFVYLRQSRAPVQNPQAPAPMPPRTITDVQKVN